MLGSISALETPHFEVFLLKGFHIGIFFGFFKTNKTEKKNKQSPN